MLLQWESFQTWMKATSHITKGKNVFLGTHCQICLSCEINQVAVCAAFCLNMLTSSNQNPSLSDSMSCRAKAVVRERGLCDVGHCFPAALFHTWNLVLGFPLPRWQVLFCSILQDIPLPDADHWLIGNVRVWLMSLCQIVPLSFLHQVHDPKCKITRAHIFNTWSP